MLRMVSQASDFSTSLTLRSGQLTPRNNSHQPCNISSPPVGALPTNIQSLAQKCGPQSKNEEVRRYKLEHTHFHKPFLQIKMCDSVNGLFFERIRSKCVLTSRFRSIQSSGISIKNRTSSGQVSVSQRCHLQGYWPVPTTKSSVQWKIDWDYSSQKKNCDIQIKNF